MEIQITKGARDDLVAVRRRDGSTASARVPHKGPLPHDAVHYFVERGFGMAQGFWGLLARGHDPGDLVELAKTGGHASAQRASDPDDAIVELLQAERLVEAYEALFWGGGGSADDVRDMAATGCATSFVPCPVIDAATHAAVAAAMDKFAGAWSAMRQGETICLEWK